MTLREQFSDSDWIGFACLFLLCWRGVARADGQVDANEEAVRDRLVRGEEAANLLPLALHNRLDSLPDLAQDVLSFGDDDRRSFLGFVASTQSERELAEAALRTDVALPRWIDEASTSDERWNRAANAKGLRLEAFHFALRTARASGPRFGRKISEEELRSISALGGQILELPLEDASAVVAATGGVN